jgi:hypothetical protein
MDWEPRLKKICEAAFPYPEKCCSSCKTEIGFVRKTREYRYKKILAGLDSDGKEKQVREWEEKYLVNASG